MDRRTEGIGMLSTDAFPNGKIAITSRKTINAKVLQQIENDLEEFEKISVLFLITANDPLAFDMVFALLKNRDKKPNIIVKFVENNLDLWEGKLLEALCIINNLEVLKNLGFDPSDIIWTYHSSMNSHTAKINVGAKVLYRLFESFNGEKSKLLLQRVYEDDGLERQLPEDNYCLELHALYWLKTQYITISSDGRGNLSKLLKHLKKLGYHDEPICREMEHYSTTSIQCDSCSMEKSLSNDRRLEASEEINICPTDDRIKNIFIKKGKCVIINEVNFFKQTNNLYDKRDGSCRDRDSLQRTFTGMGFDVEVHDDLMEREIMSSFKRVSNDFDVDTQNCLIVAILSHGYEGEQTKTINLCERITIRSHQTPKDYPLKGGIVSSDAIEIPIESIEDAMCTWKLRDVVKILIIQACQGKIMGSIAGKTASNALAFDAPCSQDISRLNNFASFQSTLKGYKSIRHKLDGTWFIQAVCEVLSQNRSISVSDFHTAVTNIVTNKSGSVNNCSSASQIPVFKSQLKNRIYFPPYDQKAAICNNL